MTRWLSARWWLEQTVFLAILTATFVRVVLIVLISMTVFLGAYLGYYIIPVIFVPILVIFFWGSDRLSPRQRAYREQKRQEQSRRTGPSGR